MKSPKQNHSCYHHDPEDDVKESDTISTWHDDSATNSILKGKMVVSVISNLAKQI